jgi:hypothetical protein
LGSGAPSRDKASAQVLETPGMCVRDTQVLPDWPSIRATSRRRALMPGEGESMRARALREARESERRARPWDG